MEKKDIKKLVIVFALVLFAGICADLTQNASNQENVIFRNDIGEDSAEENMVVTIEGMDGSFDYVIDVESVRPTQEQAEGYFELAIAEVDEAFEMLDFTEEASCLPLDEKYVNGIVSAEWYIHPWEMVNTDGTIVYEEIPTDGQIVNLSVTFCCGEYERIYQFPVRIPYLEKSQREKMFDALELWIESEMEKEGTQKVYLPSELLGTRIFWSREQSSLTFQFFMLEVVAVIAIVLARRQKREREERDRTLKMESDYPEIVNQLTLLLGAGVNIRQAWNIIATRYLDNRQKRVVNEKLAYEGIIKMNRSIQEGENEKRAYQRFATELRNASYQRLIRLLLGNLEKGAKGLCVALEQESKQAYEQRVLRAKKAGEEASTRMLIPLMLMMIVVMIMVMAPALIDFKG